MLYSKETLESTKPTELILEGFKPYFKIFTGKKAFIMWQNITSLKRVQCGMSIYNTKNAESQKHEQSTCHITECGTKSRNATNVNYARKEKYRPISIMNKDRHKTTN